MNPKLRRKFLQWREKVAPGEKLDRWSTAIIPDEATAEPEIIIEVAEPVPAPPPAPIAKIKTKKKKSSKKDKPSN